MLTNAANIDALRTRTETTAAQKVVIVNGDAQILELLETVLDAGHYDVVFVESSAHAYSQIKRVQPNLVILCVRIDDLDGFQVLSMLKLDEDTRAIPLLTCLSEYELPAQTTTFFDREEDDDLAEPVSAASMN